MDGLNLEQTFINHKGKNSSNDIVLEIASKI